MEHTPNGVPSLKQNRLTSFLSISFLVERILHKICTIAVFPTFVLVAVCVSPSEMKMTSLVECQVPLPSSLRLQIVFPNRIVVRFKGVAEGRKNGEWYARLNIFLMLLFWRCFKRWIPKYSGNRLYKI